MWVSFCSQGKGSLYDVTSWLPTPMFLQGISVSGPMFLPGWGLCPGILCPGGSLSRGFLVQGFCVQGVLCPGVLCQGGSLSRWVSVQGVSVRGSLLRGSLSSGSLSGRPFMVKRGYWKELLFTDSGFVHQTVFI